MKVRRLDELLRTTLSGEPAWLLLRFRPTEDEIEDWTTFSQALPWLAALGERGGGLCEDLRRHGLGVVACNSEEEAQRLLEQVADTYEQRGRLSSPGEWVFGQVFTPERRSAGAVIAPEVQRQHRVYSTPPALVGYLVRSVQRLLKEKLGWEAGLADRRVRLLDLAACTMPFLLAAWRLALEATWHRGGARGVCLREHLLPHSLAIELLPELPARGLRHLARLLRAYGHAPTPAELPTILGDALAPVRELLDFPANVIFGNPPWGGGSGRAGGWIDVLLADSFRVKGEPLRERSSKWLHADAVRFLRLAQWKIEQAGEGIAALVLPHNGLDAPTFTGLRASLLATFDEIYALDLHGNRRQGERCPKGEPDENIFAGIGQGVALFLLIKRPGLPKRVRRADLHGRRRAKLGALAASELDTTIWRSVEPHPSVDLDEARQNGTNEPAGKWTRIGSGKSYLSVAGDSPLEREYERGFSLPEIFPVWSTGVITGCDPLAIALNRQALEDKLRCLREAGKRCGPSGKVTWHPSLAALRADPEWRGRIASLLFRPFDHRFFFNADYWLERSRRTVTVHMNGGDNLALVASRQARDKPGVLITRSIAGHKAASRNDVSSLFPLYLVAEGCRVPNLAPALLARLAESFGAKPQPEALLGYVYAVLYDPIYRARYSELLRRGFARIPFPKEPGLFLRLADLGGKLIGLHLLADPRLDRPPVYHTGPAEHRLGTGLRTVLDYREAERTLYVNTKGTAFKGIAPEALRYNVGGHPVLARWLQARAERVLSAEEAGAFCRIATALALTVEVEERIAEVRVECGWTGGRSRRPRGPR
jgi:type ISP restriction-modification system protein